MKKFLSAALILIALVTTVRAKLLDQGGNITASVVSIFNIMGFPNELKPTLDQLNDFGQKNFLRPQKSERRSPEAIEHYKKLLSTVSADNQQELLKLFGQIGDINAIFPSTKKADYILIMGSTIQSMRTRLMFLNDLLQNNKINCTPDTPIVFLTGDRKLFDSESEDVLRNPAPFTADKNWKAPEILPQNEMELGEFVWNQLALSQELKSHPVTFVKSPKREDQKRAQTDDTVKAWLDEKNIKPGHCLIISENPYIYYQELTTQLVFKRVKPEEKGFTFEAVGSSNREADQELPINLGILLDNLARTIYLLKQLHSN